MSLRFTNWLWIVLLLGASVLLYHTSYRVQDLAYNLSRLDTAQVAEQESIHVLEAEWSYLTAPARLQQLADKYLPLKPAKTAQIAQAGTLARKIPARAPPMLALAGPDVNTAPDETAAPHTVLTRTASIGADGR